MYTKLKKTNRQGITTLNALFKFLQPI